jgi:hypothetical protein
MRSHGRGEITKISKLFEAYATRFKAPEKTVIKAFVEVVQDLFGFTLKDSYCAYTPSSKILRLLAPGPLKTEILIKKKEILTHLKGRLGEKSAPKEIL